MNQSFTEKRESVSLDVLKDKLPDSCYNAIIASLENPNHQNLDDSLYDRYFNSKGPEILNVEEQKELSKKHISVIHLNYATASHEQCT